MDLPRLNAFITSIRRTENADTRMGIRKDEEKPEGKKREGGDKDDDENAGEEDTATISVQALIAFLNGLLREQDDLQKQQQPAAPVTPAARAASAYARHETAPPPAQTAPQSSASDTPALSDAEKEAIQALLQDAHSLAEKGVETLLLRKAETFLKSLQNAVYEARR